MNYREIKPAYTKDDEQIYVYTNSDGVYVGDNESKTLTNKLNEIDGEINKGLQKIEENSAQLSESVQSIENLQKNKINWLQGKTINFMGDSITYGQDPIDGGRVDKPYPDIIAEMLGCKSNNYGEPGIAITEAGMCIKVLDMDVTADVNVVLGGTNDWGAGRTLGKAGDISANTLYGALDLMCNNLIDRFPNAINVLVTPLKRNDVSSNSAGYSLLEVVNAIKYIGKKYNFPVIDLYNNTPNINPNVSKLKNKWQPDGLHLTQEGYYLLAKKVSTSLLSLQSYTSNISSGTITISSILDIKSHIETITKDENGMVNIDMNVTFNSISAGQGVLCPLPVGFETDSTSKIGNCIMDETGIGGFINIPCFIVGNNLIVYFSKSFSTSKEVYLSITYRTNNV